MLYKERQMEGTTKKGFLNLDACQHYFFYFTRGMQGELCAYICFFCHSYGECHPVFFIGKLEDSIKEALMGKAREVHITNMIL